MIDRIYLHNEPFHLLTVIDEDLDTVTYAIPEHDWKMCNMTTGDKLDVRELPGPIKTGIDMFHYHTVRTTIAIETDNKE